jgi:hypothetical protein
MKNLRVSLLPNEDVVSNSGRLKSMVDETVQQSSDADMLRPTLFKFHIQYVKK